MGLWSFVRSLFLRRRSSGAGRPAPSPEPEAALAAAPPQPGPTAAGASAPASPSADALELPREVIEDDEDLWAPDEDDDWDGEPDPYIQDPAPALDFGWADIIAARLVARDAALSGEHRLPLSTPAGPGSLAEALNVLLDEGRVEAEYVDDQRAGPLMIYRPVAQGV